MIKKIKKIPIRTNCLNFIEDYLKRIVKEIAAWFQVEHCGILLFIQSTLLKDLLVEIYERQDTTVLYPDDIASFPWLSETDNEETIIHHINDYYKLLNQDETQNKKPDIIAEVLLEVFDLRSVYIIKKNEIRGIRWYQADIKENNKIESCSGIFIESVFELMLKEAKTYCPGFIEVPIKNNGDIIGKLFVGYGKRENDQPFKEEIYRILLGTAHALSELMYY